MAGFFPDAPAPRMAIDVDGSQGFWINNQAQVTQLTPTQMATINNEQPVYANSSYTGTTRPRLTIIFPELREIAAVYPVVQTSSGGYTFDLEVSSDTTSGVDGTWEHVLSVSSAGVNSLPDDVVSPGYRTPLTDNLPVVARAIRLGATSSQAPYINLFHIYGTIAPGEAAHRLTFWHPTLDEPMPAAWLDWGDIRQDTTGEQHFRVKNLSPTSAASDVTLTMSALSVTDALAMHRFSVGAGDQVSTLPIGDLAPGATSPVVTLHRDMAGAEVGLRTLRLHAAATTWE